MRDLLPTSLRIALLLLLLYGALLGLVFVYQRSLQYFPATARVTAAKAGLADFTDVVLETEDGERIVGWWKQPEPGKAVLLYFHGNGGGLINRRDRARLLTRDGRGLLIISYRGYSGSSGSPTETGLRADGAAAYAWITKSYEPRRVVLYGESLGSGVATWLASGREVGGLILDAPFTSAADIAKLSYWFFPVDWLMRDQFRSVDWIKQVEAPILVLHGERDGIIPVAFGERLAAAAPEPKRFVRLPGVDHVSVLERGGLAEVERFLADVERRLGP